MNFLLQKYSKLKVIRNLLYAASLSRRQFVSSLEAAIYWVTSSKNWGEILKYYTINDIMKLEILLKDLHGLEVKNSKQCLSYLFSS